MKAKEMADVLAALHGAAVAAALFLGAGLAFGEVVVKWGSSKALVTASTSLNRYAATSFVSESSIGPGTDITGNGTTGDLVRYSAFTTNVIFSPVSGYTGPAFYGGFLCYSTAASPSLDTVQVYNNAAAPGDAIYLVSRNAKASMPVLFKLDEFKPGGVFGVNGSSTLSAASASCFSANARFLVKSMGTYYISQPVIAMGVNGFVDSCSTTTVTIASVNWAVYPVTEGTTALEFSGSSFPVSGSTFTRIEEVGFFIQTAAGTGNKFSISYYQADLAPRKGTFIVVR